MNKRDKTRVRKTNFTSETEGGAADLPVAMSPRPSHPPTPRAAKGVGKVHVRETQTLFFSFITSAYLCVLFAFCALLFYRMSVLRVCADVLSLQGGPWNGKSWDGQLTSRNTGTCIISQLNATIRVLCVVGGVARGVWLSGERVVTLSRNSVHGQFCGSRFTLRSSRTSLSDTDGEQSQPGKGAPRGGRRH